MESKDDLRQQVRAQIKLWRTGDAKTVEQDQRSFADNLLAFLKEHSGVWAAFKALPGEPALDKATAQSGLQWVYPRTDDDQLSFWQPPPSNGFQKGPLGNLEPVASASKSVSLSQIAGVLVPGLAFDSSGSRLGRGKSFYDRALKNYAGLKVGVCFSWQIKSHVPTDPWDIKMDVLISEKDVRWITRPK